MNIEALGDCALSVQLGERIDPELNLRALAIAATLRAAALSGVLDVAPAYASVCVRYDPGAWIGTRSSPFDALAARVADLVNAAGIAPVDATLPPLEIPVCYGGEFGPDLAEVARHAGVETDAVIALHQDAEYRVAMLGFAPGFPYLFGLDPRLYTPRRSSPRTRVPAGSVAIGGAQTGIYPRELPGGWQVIGRTPLRLFDIARDPPALLAPGRRVRFRAITLDAFAAAAQ